jgi:hypothetical protein
MNYYKFKGLSLFKDMLISFDSIHFFLRKLYNFLFSYYRFLKNDNNDYDSLIEFYEQNDSKFLIYHKQMDLLK